MLVAFFSCLIGMQNPVRSYSPTSLIYQVQFSFPDSSSSSSSFAFTWLTISCISSKFFVERTKQGKKGDGNLPMTRIHLVEMQFVLFSFLIKQFI